MKKDIFFIDFDGTIALNDTTKCLAEAIIPEKHKIYVELFKKNKISIKQFVEDLLTSLNITKTEFINIIKANIIIDLTFKEFIQNNLEFYILSSGTKLNILSALESVNIHIEDEKIISNDIFFKDKKIFLKYPYFDEKNGVNKSYVIKKFKEKGYRIIFIGDGPSDYDACMFADIIFARKNTKLEKILKNKNLKFYSFNNFNDLLNQYKILCKK